MSATVVGERHGARVERRCRIQYPWARQRIGLAASQRQG